MENNELVNTGKEAGKQAWAGVSTLKDLPNHVVNFLQPGAGNAQPSMTDMLLNAMKEKQSKKEAEQKPVTSNPLATKPVKE